MTNNSKAEMKKCEQPEGHHNLDVLHLGCCSKCGGTRFIPTSTPTAERREAEEILKNKKVLVHGDLGEWYLKEDVLNAMTEYAQQEHAWPGAMKRKDCISFAEFLQEGAWIRDPFPNKYTGEVMWSNLAGCNDSEEPQSKTIKQLYKDWLRSQVKGGGA